VGTKKTVCYPKPERSLSKKKSTVIEVIESDSLKFIRDQFIDYTPPLRIKDFNHKFK
jgi:hypothetical protein